MYQYKCLNCGMPLHEDHEFILPYCSLQCAEQIELVEYLPEQLEMDLE